jgi:hypothetical protein
MQLLDLPCLVRIQAGVLLLSAMKRMLTDRGFANQIGCRHPQLGLLEHGHDLLRR